MADEVGLAVVSSIMKKEPNTFTNEETLKLITLWEREEVLYNGKHKEHWRRKSRNAAMLRVLEQMENKALTLEEIHKKMHRLRTYYGKEMKKEKKRSIDPDGCYVSQWPLYSRLHFLRDFIIPKQTESGNNASPLNTSIPEYDTTDSDDQAMQVIKVLENSNISQEQESADRTDIPVVTPTTSNKKKRAADLERDVLTTCLSDLKRRRDLDTVSDGDALFGHYVANQLKRIPDGLPKEMLKIEIQQSIIKVLHPPAQPAISTVGEDNFAFN